MHRGYEPSRITALSQHCRWSIAQLDAIHSNDPAAVEALAAIASIRSVIADSIMTATSEIGFADPLGGPIGLLHARALAQHRASPLDRWMDQQFPSAAATGESDEQLINALRAYGDGAPFAARFDPDHPHWDGLTALATSIATRSVDPKSGELTPFGQLLIDNAWMLPALPVALASGDFHPSFGVALIEATFDPDLAQSPDRHRLEAFGVDLVLGSLMEHPRALSELVLRDQGRVLDGNAEIEDTIFFDLLDSDVVDQQMLADVIAVVLGADGPVDLADIQRTLAMFVQAANTTSFERGFSEPVALALAVAFVDVLPNLDDQIRVNEPIYFDEILDSDDAIEFGSYGDVRDFIGAILVNPAGLVLLFALGAQAEDMVSGDPDATDVNAFGRLLRDSFEENLAEIEIAAARSRDDWIAVTAAVATAIGLGPVGRALGPAGVKFAQAAVKRFGAAATGSAQSAHSKDDVGFLSNLMIRFGSYEGFLDQHGPADASDRTAVGEARAKLAEAWAQFEAGEPLGVVSETLGDVGAQIELFDRADFLDRVREATDHVEPVSPSDDLD